MASLSNPALYRQYHADSPYPYSLADAEPLQNPLQVNFDNDTYQSNLQQLRQGLNGYGEKVTSQIELICAIAQRVVCNKAVILKSSNPRMRELLQAAPNLQFSIFFVPMQEGVRIYVSCHMKPLYDRRQKKDVVDPGKDAKKKNDEADPIKIIWVIKIDFNHARQLTGTSCYVKISLDYTQVSDFFLRRLSIMQRLGDKQDLFPITPDYLRYAAKSGKAKLAIFQEGAQGNLAQFFKFVKLNKLVLKKLHVSKRILAPVRCLHERGIVHRDIKPENYLVFFTRNCPPGSNCARPKTACRHIADFRIKLTDFGFSCNATDTEALRDRCGTHKWAAAENYDADEGSSLRGVPLDVWSLGQMLDYIKYGEKSLPKGDLPNLTLPPEDSELTIGRLFNFYVRNHVDKKLLEVGVRSVLEKELQKNRAINKSVQAAKEALETIGDAPLDHLYLVEEVEEFINKESSDAVQERPQAGELKRVTTEKEFINSAFMLLEHLKRSLTREYGAKFLVGTRVTCIAMLQDLYLCLRDSEHPDKEREEIRQVQESERDLQDNIVHLPDLDDEQLLRDIQPLLISPADAAKSPYDIEAENDVVALYKHICILMHYLGVLKANRSMNYQIPLDARTYLLYLRRSYIKIILSRYTICDLIEQIMLRLASLPITERQLAQETNRKKSSLVEQSKMCYQPLHSNCLTEDALTWAMRHPDPELRPDVQSVEQVLPVRDPVVVLDRSSCTIL